MGMKVLLVGICLFVAVSAFEEFAYNELELEDGEGSGVEPTQPTKRFCFREFRACSQKVETRKDRVICLRHLNKCFNERHESCYRMCTKKMHQCRLQYPGVYARVT